MYTAPYVLAAAALPPWPLARSYAHTAHLARYFSAAGNFHLSIHFCSNERTNAQWSLQSGKTLMRHLD